ncbi:hypothetical protein SAY86_012096 [Trapa natans]|uniref:Uncharacterized protein n=1 Tax=Trapa natans TaxID=22666 RepID=A0AAN7R8X0_TRANT|nr:hypothetical protein SAY86_012096 [Trapa natans]
MQKQPPASMLKLCPNYDKEDGLDTVLEVPIPEEMFTNMGSNGLLRWQNLRAFMRAQSNDGKSSSSSSGSSSSVSRLSSGSRGEFSALLKLVGSPLIPFQAQSDQALTRPIRDCSIEASTAKYIVQQYVAATGGQGALNAVSSMYAVGQVKMIGSEMSQNDGNVQPRGDYEVGGFVLWQKNPDLWFLELVVSGFKVSAGSDGKVSWSQSSTQPCNAICIGENTISDEDCFVLKIEAAPEILRVQSSPHTELVHHKVWGYFSQRTGLLIHFEDSKLVRMKTASKGNHAAFWETTMETAIGDYRYVDGINIAHCGKTSVTLFRYGGKVNHKRKIEETWTIEEVDFNICGLSTDCFLPPADLKKDPENGDHGIGNHNSTFNTRPCKRARPRKVVVVQNTGTEQMEEAQKAPEEAEEDEYWFSEWQTLQ